MNTYVISKYNFFKRLTFQVWMCTDIDNHATSRSGIGCIEYKTTNYLCGALDDSDFDAKRMCCSCGGGRKYGNKKIKKLFSYPFNFISLKYKYMLYLFSYNLLRQNILSKNYLISNQ